MQSPRYVAKYGAIRFLSCPGRAGIVSKFRAVSGTACKMPSPTPPKSAKVELRHWPKMEQLKTAEERAQYLLNSPTSLPWMRTRFGGRIRTSYEVFAGSSAIEAP